MPIVGSPFRRVEYVKPAQRMAVIHLGADFLLRPVYRPDDWQHEFFVLDRDGMPKTRAPAPVTIAGPLCFGGDILAHDVPLPPIEVGRLYRYSRCGAYTLSMWSRHCSRGIPAVHWIRSAAGATHFASCGERRRPRISCVSGARDSVPVDREKHCLLPADCES